MKYYNWIIIVLALALLGLIYENDRKVKKAYQRGYEIGYEQGFTNALLDEGYYPADAVNKYKDKEKQWKEN